MLNMMSMGVRGRPSTHREYATVISTYQSSSLSRRNDPLGTAVVEHFTWSLNESCNNGIDRITRIGIDVVSAHND